VLLGQWNAGDYGRMSMQLELEDTKRVQTVAEGDLGKFLGGRPRRKRKGNMNVQLRDTYFKSWRCEQMSTTLPAWSLGYQNFNMLSFCTPKGVTWVACASSRHFLLLLLLFLAMQILLTNIFGLNLGDNYFEINNSCLPFILSRNYCNITWAKATTASMYNSQSSGEKS